ncbi:MATE efflux family protein [Clostridioides difficile CD160]|nr:MATE efflux family protein [Clostridioides difficile CD160]
MDNEQRIKLLKETPIKKLLLKMGIPTMIGMLVTGFYNLVDAYFVGGLGTSQMGAVSIAFPLGQVIVGIALLFGGGVSSYLSRLLGEGNNSQANHAASTALYSSIFIGIISIVLIECFIDKIIFALGATDTIFPYAKQYAVIYVASSIFNVFNVTMNNIATSEGSTKISMISMLLGAGLNLVLAPICIYGLDMGISGAAVATAIAQAITSLMYVVYLLMKKSIFNFSIREFRFEREIYLQILKVGIPTLVFQILTSVAIGLTNKGAQGYGDSAIAAMGIVTRIMSMGSYAVFGFEKGFQPIAGYSYGAKQYMRLNEAISTTLKWTTTFCLLMSLVLIIFPEPIISLFSTNDNSVIEIGTFALRISSVMFIFFGFGTVYSILFLALGKAKEGAFLSVSRQGLFFIPTILLLPSIMGINGVIFAQPIADLFMVISAAILAVKLKKEIRALSVERI